MGRSQRHRVEEQGFSARGNIYEQGAINDQICKALGGAISEARPVLASINPATAVKGSADLTMHALGSGFDESCVILFNGGAELTTFVDAGDITTIVKPSLVTVAGSYPVQVQKGGVLNSADTEMFVFTDTMLAATGGRQLPLGPLVIARVDGDPGGIALVLTKPADVRVGDVLLVEATGNTSVNGSWEVVSVDGNTIVVASDYELASPIEAKGRVTITAEA